MRNAILSLLTGTILQCFFRLLFLVIFLQMRAVRCLLCSLTGSSTAMVPFPCHLLTMILLLVVVIPHVRAVCYYPNGEANDDIPCNAGPVSVCCTRGWTCLTNGVCQNDNDSSCIAWGRHSCTDSTFNSPECPRFCQSGKTWATPSVGVEAVLTSDGLQST